MWVNVRSAQACMPLEFSFHCCKLVWIHRQVAFTIQLDIVNGRVHCAHKYMDLNVAPSRLGLPSHQEVAPSNERALGLDFWHVKKHYQPAYGDLFQTECQDDPIGSIGVIR